jgi:hypothetical protein
MGQTQSLDDAADYTSTADALARSPVRQPDCFRLEHLSGGPCTHWKTLPRTAHAKSTDLGQSDQFAAEPFAHSGTGATFNGLIQTQNCWH